MNTNLIRDPRSAIYCGTDSHEYVDAAFIHPSDALNWMTQEFATFGNADQVIEVNYCRARADAFITRKHFIAWVRIAQGEPAETVIARGEAQQSRRMGWAA